ncbi:enoyl-CoA hydratase/isomerase family protein [Ruegeria aquimaris]|uniref:Enoyl-CoA hydratase-related protein n=1 Tax=Ruegeria aquimaris TaxID=2984333 RepID=A0ABT3AGS3_9RHOB|nr:enoyl-CoA hydratase-related protein [Ruegeria sp. XHP0148]MCV2887825.1 enoyl-CoA hydratase-related protein [Ruegeria sp. XHP0148]
MLPVSNHYELEQTESWLTVWLNEPQARNPLTAARVSDLLTLCAALQGSDLRGVVFRGRGGVFCAGGDLKAFQAVMQGEAGHAEVVALSLQAANLFDAVSGLPQFTVMAVEGAAMAGGLGLACCGDMVLAEETAHFALSEVRLGLTPAQIAPFVVARLGMRTARRLMLSGESVGGDTARGIGLADRLVPAGGMDAALDDLRRAMAPVAPQAVAMIKRQLSGLSYQSRNDQRQSAAEAFASALLSAEAREGIAAFLEKRKPRWAEG